MPSVGGGEIRAFLTKLAVEERVAVATQKRALNALVFYFRDVEGKNLGDFSDFTRARRRVRVPVVLAVAGDAEGSTVGLATAT